ncbi:MAG TPA: glycosyltransferase [Beijerinckiaceae bacterium]|nr:glycosyltransferase [Beijerinckiaceae bacterium]
MRVLIAVTHLLGAGHLTRAAAIARAFARAGHDATLVSGGRPAPLIVLDGVRLVQLPPVQTAGIDFATLLNESGRLADPARLAERRRLMLAALERTHPEVIITELFPFGRRALAGEFLALLERARAMQPRALIVSSVRDILVAPTKPERVAETHARLRTFYDAVLVHGDPNLILLDASWPVDAQVRDLTHYTGYVDNGAPAAHSLETEGEIVVSGGSSTASLPLHHAAVGAATLLPEHRWRVLVGTGIPEDLYAALVKAAPANAAVERARPDFRALLGRARLSVSQAGYNTVVDLLRARTPAVLIPFEGERETEQRVRAERMADLGLASVLLEQSLSPAVLAQYVADALAHPRPHEPTVRLDGADCTVAIVKTLANRRSTDPEGRSRLYTGAL